MDKTKALKIFIILVLLGGNIFLGYKYYEAQSKFLKADQALAAQQDNRKAAEFLELFISKVLKSETEVDFEERLKLENAVRELEDPAILEQWKKFTDSQDDVQAQREVKTLMEMLVKKIK